MLTIETFIATSYTVTSCSDTATGSRCLWSILPDALMLTGSSIRVTSVDDFALSGMLKQMLLLVAVLADASTFHLS